MADQTPSTPLAPTTAEGFLADRMSFWYRFTGFTTRVTVGLLVFVAWLWWAAFAGFSLLHIVLLPIAIAGVLFFLK